MPGTAHCLMASCQALLLHQGGARKAQRAHSLQPTCQGRPAAGCAAPCHMPHATSRMPRAAAGALNSSLPAEHMAVAGPEASHAGHCLHAHIAPALSSTQYWLQGPCPGCHACARPPRLAGLHPAPPKQAQSNPAQRSAAQHRLTLDPPPAGHIPLAAAAATHTAAAVRASGR